VETVLKFRYIRPDQDGDLPPPAYMTPGSAGMDVRAAVTESIVLNPGDIRVIPTGFAIAVPPGHEAQIRPRSGLAARHGITLVNSPGTIDADYRGEICVPLINLGIEPYIIERGHRIAQMVIQRVHRLTLQQVLSLDETRRGDGGFGHTGY